MKRLLICLLLVAVVGCGSSPSPEPPPVEIDAEAYYKRGVTRSLLGQQNMAKASVDLNKAKRLGHSSYETPIDLSGIPLSGPRPSGDISRPDNPTGDIPRSDNLVETIQPDNAKTYTSRGLQYHLRGVAYGPSQSDNAITDFTLAIADFTEAIRINPDYAEAYVNRGVTRNELKWMRWISGSAPLSFQINQDRARGGDKAIADFTEAIRINPDFAEAYFRRGAVYRRGFLWNDAIADFTEAIRINPDFAEAYFRRGGIYRELGEQDDRQAIADFTEAIRINPDFAEAYFRRGAVYRRKGLWNDAIADFTEAIRINPDFAEAYYNRGVSYSGAGQKNKAMAKAKASADATSGIRIDPDLLLPDKPIRIEPDYDTKALADFTEAIADLSEAIRINPDYAEAYYSRGIAYRENDDKAKAAADFAKAKELGYKP